MAWYIYAAGGELSDGRVRAVMAIRDNPTARQVRLGAELRKLRESAGKTARESAGLLGNDQAKMSHIEGGRLGISEERIRRLATFYSCDDVALVEALCAIAREQRGTFWWDSFRGILAPGFLDMAELEHHAVNLRSMQTVSLPGVFQTEEYARAVFEGHLPRLPIEEVETRVEYRMRRRVIFDREEPPQFTALIHEAALRMRFGGRKVARRQLEYVMQVSEWPSVTVRVVPFTSEDFVEATQPVLYASGFVPQLDTVQVDTAVGGRFVLADAELRKYRNLLDVAQSACLSAEESRQLIHHIAREL